MASRLKKLRIREVAFCRAGINQEADIALWKAQPDEPRSFEEVADDRNLADAARVVEGRMQALAQSVWEIVYSDVEDKESRIKESVRQFAANMDGDLGRILSGELLKCVDLDEAPTVGTIGELIHRALERARMEGTRMRTEKSVFDDCSQEVRAAAWALAVERNTAQEILEALRADHETAKQEVQSLKAQLEKAGGGAGDGDGDLLKGLSPEAAAAFKKEREEKQALSQKVSELVEKGRRRELTDVAKAFADTTMPEDKLTEVLLKADRAGFLDELREVLKPTIELAKMAKALEELGRGDEPQGEVYGAIQKAAAELQKLDPKLTREKAIVKVLEQRPDLYRQHMEEARA